MNHDTIEHDRITKIMKQVFLPLEENPNYLSDRLNYDAQKACYRAGIRVDDLVEKNKEDFYIHNQGMRDQNALLQKMENSDEMVIMRWKHHEMRRRRKLHILWDHIRNTRSNSTQAGKQ